MERCVSISGIGGSDSPFSSITHDKTRQKLQGNSGLLGGTAVIDPASLVAPTVPDNDPVKQFTDFMKQTPEQRMQAAWLQRHGITPEEFAAMSPDEQKKILDQMRAEIEEEMKQKVAEGNSKPQKVDLLV